MKDYEDILPNDVITPPISSPLPLFISPPAFFIYLNFYIKPLLVIKCPFTLYSLPLCSYVLNYVRCSACMFCSMKVSKTEGAICLRESVNPKIRAVIGQQDLDREYRRSSKLNKWRVCESSPYSRPILRTSAVNSWGISSS